MGDRMVRLWDLAAGKCSVTLTNHKVWKCPRGAFERNIQGHGAIVNGSAIREQPDGSSILIGGTDNGYLHFWDWRSSHKFQSLATIPQPGSMSSENGIFDLCLDQSQSRLITGECDKTVKIYREDPDATPETHPLDWKAGKLNAAQRY